MTNPTKERIAELRATMLLECSGKMGKYNQADLNCGELLALLDTIETLQKERDKLQAHLRDRHGCESFGVEDPDYGF